MAVNALGPALERPVRGIAAAVRYPDTDAVGVNLYGNHGGSSTH